MRTASSCAMLVFVVILAIGGGLVFAVDNAAPPGPDLSNRATESSASPLLGTSSRISRNHRIGAAKTRLIDLSRRRSSSWFGPSRAVQPA
jgi:hypothetical protein